MLTQQFSPAINHLFKDYVLRSDHADSSGLLESLNSLSGIYYYLYSYDKSMNSYQESSDHTLFTISGNLHIEMGNENDSAWIEADDCLNDVLNTLTMLDWNGGQ